MLPLLAGYLVVPAMSRLQEATLASILQYLQGKATRLRSGTGAIRSVKSGEVGELQELAGRTRRHTTKGQNATPDIM